MKTLFIKARWAAVAMAAVLLVGAWLYGTRPVFTAASGAQRELPIYCVDQAYKVASLTFDAAWGNEDTQQLIDILGKYDVKATFFVVGDWARKYPESVKALHDAGHEIMNHSDTHAHMPQLSREQIIEDINNGNDAVEAACGVRPTLFRAPYGEYDNKLITTLQSLGMETIQWDVDSLDWKNPTPANIQKRVTTRVKPGSIVLFHNAAKNTPTALPGIIEHLQKEGYQLIPVSQLIYKAPYTLDHTGRQFPAAASQTP